MKAIVKNKTQSRMLAVVLTVLLVLFCFTATANAACSSYSSRYSGPGTGSTNGGDLTFDLGAYVYYHSHTTTAIDIHSLVAIITATGEDPVDTLSYTFDGGNGANNHTDVYDFFPDLQPDETERVEINAHNLVTLAHLNSTVLTKPSGGAAYAFIGAGVGDFAQGWSCWWRYGTTSWDFQFL